GLIRYAHFGRDAGMGEVDTQRKKNPHQAGFASGYYYCVMWAATSANVPAITDVSGSVALSPKGLPPL
ncbi:MAG: hypothetical protein ACR2HF_05155, partial [Methylococcaceae bacterium]